MFVSYLTPTMRGEGGGGRKPQAAGVLHFCFVPLTAIIKDKGGDLITFMTITVTVD